MEKEIKIETSLFHSLGNPKGRTLYHFFYASHIRHNFPYKMRPISMSYLSYFRVISENSTSAFNNWGDLRLVFLLVLKRQ